MTFLLILLIITLVTLLYLWLRKGFDYWKKQGVPYLEPSIIVGNLRESFLFQKNTGVIYSEIYKKFDGFPFVGVYRAHTPCLLVRDPEFIKNIMVKDFKSFPNNEFQVDKNVDPILGRNPFFTKDEEWRSRRTQLTPAFTSGRMKAMYPLLEAVSERLVKFVENQPEATNEIGMDAKEVCTKFTVDNVASCAFGIEARCFQEQKSDFRSLAERFISPGGWSGFILFLLTIFPYLTKFIGVKLVSKDVEGRLLETVRQSLEYRKKNNIVRPDFLDFVSKLEYETKNLRTLDITAHAASFFADGFETSSLSMSYFLFELANNQEAQDKLREEIICILEEKYDGKFCYEAIQDMPYLHACMYEAMRKNPVIGMLSKTCTQEYSYTSDNKDFKKMTVTVHPGTTMLIPMALHMDTKYYPEPEKFKPERFLNNANQSLCLVFGEGPRICLGQRFGVLQIKTGVAHLIKNFRITVNSKTRTPFDYLPYYLLLIPKGGIRLNFHKL